MDNYTHSNAPSQPPTSDFHPEYLVIPFEILYRKDLNEGEKMTASMLKFLRGKKGYLWWTDKKLADLLDTSERTIRRRLLKLNRLKITESHYDRRKHVRYVRYIA